MQATSLGIPVVPVLLVPAVPKMAGAAPIPTIVELGVSQHSGHALQEEVQAPVVMRAVVRPMEIRCAAALNVAAPQDFVGLGRITVGLQIAREVMGSVIRILHHQAHPPKG